jgi:ABC-type transporter MlaC component
MRRSHAYLAGAVAAALVGAMTVTTTALADEPPATRVIARLNAALLDVLQHAEPLGFQGRLAKIAPAVNDAFDIEFMAEKSIGKYWKPLSDADKARWVALFKEFTAANYAGNFDKFSGQRFELHGEEPEERREFDNGIERDRGGVLEGIAHRIAHHCRGVQRCVPVLIFCIHCRTLGEQQFH